MQYNINNNYIMNMCYSLVVLAVGSMWCSSRLDIKLRTSLKTGHSDHE